MLKKIRLYGKLKSLHAAEIELDVSSVAEAVRALTHQIPKFRETLSEGHYRVCLDKPDTDNTIDESMLKFELGRINTIHIIPVLEGDKNGGIGKIVAGIALVALSFALPGAGAMAGGLFSAAAGATGISAMVLNLGISMALGGVAALLSPQVKPASGAAFEKPEQRPSFLFNGPVNTTEQGGPVPLVYGIVRCGSQVVSAGLATENRP